MTREELRNIAAIHIMAGGRFTPDGAAEAVGMAMPLRMLSWEEQAECAIGLADALVAKLEPAKAEALTQEPK